MDVHHLVGAHCPETFVATKCNLFCFTAATTFNSLIRGDSSSKRSSYHPQYFLSDNLIWIINHLALHPDLGQKCGFPSIGRITLVTMANIVEKNVK